MDTTVLGLSLLTVNVGLSGMKTDAAGVPTDAQHRALAETAVLAGVAAYLSHNWWPAVFPVLYLGFDYAWSMRHGQPPQVMASENTEDYSYGD